VSTTGDGRIGGRYELVDRIARGGGGTVWRAEDTVLGRTVAVKAIEIPDELSDEERRRARTRVLQEARAAARLDHPSAVVVHDVLDDEDRLHLVMELVQAPTLRQRVARDGPLPEVEVATIGLGLTDVLAVAHLRGIVHRDVKPSNIFVLEDGGVKLADFGIAAMAGEASLTRTGTALGSPSYLAPEQAQGHAASPAADAWGLGASLYYAVEGEPPFDRGSAIATVHAVVHEPARPFQRADRTQPLLGSLLAKRPEDRPALPVIEDRLRSLVDDASAPAAPPPVMPAPTEELVLDDPPPEPPAAQPRPADDTEPAAAASPADPDDEQRRRRAFAVLGTLAVAALLLVAAIAVFDGPDAADDPLTAEAPEREAADDGDGEQAAGDEDASDEPEDGDPDGGGSEDDADTDGAETGADGDGDGGEEAGDESSSEPATTADGDTVIPEADVPDGWQVVEGATYRVAVPEGWQVRDGAGNLTDYVDPDSGAYLRVDWTDDPAGDPVADWEANEAGFAQRQDDYQRIRLEPATFRGEDAALWEYTYTSGGASLHAVNLNLLAGERAYALNLQSPAGDWDDVGALFPAIAGGFAPAG
jgi:eukaryotic-like serine/threonine-protein kinase